MKRSPATALLFLFAALNLSAQDSIPSPVKKKKHSPKAACIMSACLPGLGQVYNGKYWKVPVVYAGLGISGWFVYDLNKEYRRYKDAYIFRTDNDPATNDTEFALYTDAQVKENVDFYRRYRDMNIFICGLVYALNIVDAGVDAHLKSFDVSNNLSMSLRPPSPGQPYMLSLRLKF